MFDSIFNFGVKELTGLISGHTDMEAGEAQDTTNNTIVDTIKNEFLNGNSDVQNMVKSGDISEDNPAMESIVAKAAPLISEKLGIPEGIASMIISKALPFIMSTMDLGSLTSMLGGSEEESGQDNSDEEPASQSSHEDQTEESDSNEDEEQN